jgi:hypothetical protein
MELAKRQSGKGGMLLVHTFERSRSQCDVHGHQISVVVDTAIVPVATLGKELDDVHIGKSPVLLRQLLHCIVDLRLVETPIPKAKIVRATAANTSGVATVIDH